MSDEKAVNIARAVQAQVHAAEEAIDTALGESANLIETCITSRRALQLCAARSTDIHENTLKAMMALNEAQAYMAEAHKGLSRIRKHIGIPSAVMPGLDTTDMDKRPVGRLASLAAT